MATAIITGLFVLVAATVTSVLNHLFQARSETRRALAERRLRQLELDHEEKTRQCRERREAYVNAWSAITEHANRLEHLHNALVRNASKQMIEQLELRAEDAHNSKLRYVGLLRVVASPGLQDAATDLEEFIYSLRDAVGLPGYDREWWDRYWTETKGEYFAAIEEELRYGVDPRQMRTIYERSGRRRPPRSSGRETTSSTG